jgi:O-succinylbenzoic acid--CoA ligase
MSFDANSMPGWLPKRAELTPDQIAFIQDDVTITFGALFTRVKNMMLLLRQHGVHKGSHVASLLPNALDAIVLIHALQGLGAIHIFLNTKLSPKEWDYQLTDADATHLIYADEFAHGVAQLTCHHMNRTQLRDLSHNLSFRNPSAVEDPSESPESHREIVLSDVHTIMYTSGTTGRPKGVTLTYGNHWWSAVSSSINLGSSSNDVWLLCLPVYHVGGLSILIRSVIYGFPVVIMPRFEPAQVNHAIRKHHVTLISVVSVMLSRMLEALGDDNFPASLRCVLIGGGPVPQPLLERCLVRGIPVYQTYGMTETASQIATLGQDDMLRKIGSAGKSLFPSQLKIVKENKTCLPMEIGEIVVKGPTVCNGYYRRSEATNHAFVDGWLRTGDLGYQDEEGYVFVVDRRADLIITGGENVYPAEVEAVLFSYPGIVEVGVTSMPDETWGQVPVAYMKTNTPAALTYDALRSHCLQHLAKYKVPVKFYLVQELPRNAAQKLLRRELNHITDAEEIV